ncbi:histone-lysine N-methyltransferase SETMAR [Nephila pilipes]|uniref:Histone-lysine N-methyltransferase SETMAR n=1 Tax=Nephila pilipes TaxID=299642 RepID=A0A8X6N5H0_NEPPI|nr:histone-lysine N-methyltransferase SETMAR [Nephila pilipes]
MSVGSVFTIMTEDLKKKKLCALFVPHTLTTEQKEHRIASSEDLIAAADEEPNFLKTIVTGDESWCLKYDPETKRQSSEWTSPGKGRPMKVLASKSKTKTMLLVFFDSRGIIHHEFLRQGSTVTEKGPVFSKQRSNSMFVNKSLPEFQLYVDAVELETRIAT